VTLLETVVALSIVGVTAIAALEAAGAELRAVDRSHRAVEAEALATARLAFVDLLTAQELAALPDSVASGKFPAPLDAYRWTTSTTARDDVPGVYDVTVQIAWTGGAYTLHSALYRRPAVVTR
jgi:type II secretory pathway pseudopilin PulG